MEFNGTACSYEGPTLIEEGMVEFSLSNAGDEGVAFALLRVDEAALSEELSDAPVGGDWAITDQTPAVTFGNMRFALVSPNESRLQEWAMASGIYLMDCATGEPGATEHVWRVAQVEVVAP